VASFTLTIEQPEPQSAQLNVGVKLHFEDVKDVAQFEPLLKSLASVAQALNVEDELLAQMQAQYVARGLPPP
jgi:hypothetical protein